MDTKTTFEMMEKILPDVTRILNDSVVQQAKHDIKDNKVSAVGSMEVIMTALLDGHADAVYNIIAALSDKTVEEVQQQDFKKTLAVWTNGTIDEMMSFFMPLLRMVLRA